MYKYTCPRWYGMVTGVGNIYSPPDTDENKVIDAAVRTANSLSGSKTCKVHLLQQFELVIKSVKNHAGLASIPVVVEDINR